MKEQASSMAVVSSVIFFSLRVCLYRMDVWTHDRDIRPISSQMHTVQHLPNDPSDFMTRKIIMTGIGSGSCDWGGQSQVRIAPDGPSAAVMERRAVGAPSKTIRLLASRL